MDLLTLARAITFVRYFHYGLHKGNRSIFALWMLIDHQLSPEFESPSLGRYLWTLLTFVNGFETTVLHDKLYALIGLYRRTGGIAKVPELVRPNYLRPEQEVFRDAARPVILENKSLSSLKGQNLKRSQDIPGLPPWVPAWFDTSLVRTLRKYT